MTDTPSALATPALSPMLQRALTRLRQIASGNGIDADAIALAKSDEATYTLNAELRLTPSWELRDLTERAARGAKVTTVKSKAEMQGLAKAPIPSIWLSEAQGDVQPLPGHGWGLDGKNIVLAQHTNVYGLELNCVACNGQKTVTCTHCHGRARITCPTCHGAGHDLQDQHKTCVTCLGRNEIDCPECRQGRSACKACAGRGITMEFAERRLLVAATFHWIGGAELPTELRRAIDRAGLARLTNGHADIVQLESDDKISHGVIQYQATLTFSPVTFTIDGKPIRALVLGKKGAILEMPAFLDPIVEKHLADGTLSKLRLFGDAQKIAAQLQKPEALLRDYPVGLSTNSAAQIYKQARHSLSLATRKTRWAMLAGGCIVAALFVLCYFNYWRYALRHFGLPLGFWDIVMPLAIFALGAHTAALAENQKLKRMFGIPKARSRHLRWDLVPLALVIGATYIGYLVTSDNPPRWYTDRILARDIAAHEKLVDPPID